MAEIIGANVADNTRRAIISSLDPRRMELIIYPTEQCNFRCTYCYEDFLLGKMPADVISGINNLISARVSTIRHLEMGWFGGEPLAAKDVIYEICAHAQRECAKHDVHLSGHVTTNGYFLDTDTVATLGGYGQASYQISLDGFGADHDATRKLMSGGPTFQRIWANLQALSASDLAFRIVLRVHLTTDNLDSIERLAHVLRDGLLHDPRFTVFVKPIENLGPDAAHRFTIPPAERDAIMARIHKAFGFPVPLPPMPGQASEPAAPKICYAARPNSLAIRADGTVQKCTVMMADDQNRIGQVRADGALGLDRGKMAYWMRGYDSMDAGELKCPAHQSRPTSSRTIPIVPA